MIWQSSVLEKSQRDNRQDAKTAKQDSKCWYSFFLQHSPWLFLGGLGVLAVIPLTFFQDPALPHWYHRYSHKN